MLDEFSYKESRRMWYLLSENSLETGLREMNTYIEVWEMNELGIKHEMIAVYVEVDRKDYDYDDDASHNVDGVVAKDGGLAVDGGVVMDSVLAVDGGIAMDNEDEDDTKYCPLKKEESDASSSANDKYNSDNDNEEFLPDHILRIT
ncbi:hypothetical protein CRG98_008530 [Punica granatum]|uniref:Uncharacterized protein n=1 Tax=Punica granatum TaxID=22663 RepID=A0A2I0KRE2_PUNGR|nr:hypothetical protein CRG98_008530 [Punica granatum]